MKTNLVNPTDFGLSAAQATAVEALSDDQLDYAYRLKQLQIRTEDAAFFAEANLNDDPELLDKLDDDDYVTLAKQFIDSYDFSKTEEYQWKELIWDYIMAK